MASENQPTKQEYIPGSLSESSEIFTFPFTTDDPTINFLQNHGRIMFIIRGPPGTGKDSLSKMLIDQFPTATVCSADVYFENTFGGNKRERETFRLSHEFCHSQVEMACQNNDHPIIVKNTHMKKFEMQKYLDFAAEYHYTVIMAVTLHKFKVTPEILAKSNTKGLNVEYFKRRLRQWEEVIPLMVGWFLNPDDSLYLLSELQKALDCLLGDGKFCRILNAFDKGDLLKHYKARKFLFCIAACGENLDSQEVRGYYLSDKVQENYGKCFSITILGYLVTSSVVSAIVHLNENQKSLMLKQKSKKYTNNDLDSLINSFDRLKVKDGRSKNQLPMDNKNNLERHCATIDLDTTFESTKTPAVQDKISGSNIIINVNDCSCILLAENVEPHYPKETFDSFHELMNRAVDENGVIMSDHVIELDGGMKVYRLPEDAWLVRPPYELSFKTIYTGLYL